jgi:hypothetical protein
MTTLAHQAAVRIREALEAGPTQDSEWECVGETIYELTDHRYRGTNHRVNRWSARVQTACQEHELNYDEAARVAAYIAACSPDNLRALLAERDELAKDAARMKTAIEDVLGCPYEISEDTVPSTGLDTPGLNLYQVVGTMHVSLPRYRALRAALTNKD